VIEIQQGSTTSANETGFIRAIAAVLASSSGFRRRVKGVMDLMETVPAFANDASCQKVVARFSVVLKIIFVRVIKEHSHCKRLCG
jgi:hypothetical protein